MQITCLLPAFIYNLFSRRCTLIISFLAIGWYGNAQNISRVASLDDIVELEKGKYERRFEAESDQPYSNASNNFDIKYYRAEWEVDTVAKLFRGTVTSYFVMKETGNEIAFDLADNMKVSKVTAGNTLLSFCQKNNTLKISLSRTQVAGSVDSVSISYEGAPGNGLYFISINGKSNFLTSSEPWSSRGWWPCKNGTGTKVDSIDIFIRHDVGLTAVSNGVLQNLKIDIDGKKVTHWKHNYPIATYLVAFSLANYITFDNYLPTRTGRFLVQTYCLREYKTHFQGGVQTITEANAKFMNLIGDYPFAKEKYAHVHAFFGGGMENQTCSFVGGTSEFVLVHEYAHQWFGDKVTCRSWEDMWLNEGFATFMESVFQEMKNPHLITVNRAASIADIITNPSGSVKCESSDPNVIFDHTLRYRKGSYLLQMLRWILGDEVFWRGLRSYLNDPGLAYGLATTADLRRNLEEVSGKDLGYFFDQWYIGQGYPSYQLKWHQFGNELTLYLSQVTSHNSVRFFQLPVPVLVMNKKSGTQKILVINHTENDQKLTEMIDFTVDSVAIDPFYVLVSGNNVITKTGDNILGEDLSISEIQVAPNPVKGTIGVKIKSESQKILNATVYDMNGRLMLQDKIKVFPGEGLYEINNRTNLSAGAYLLKVESVNGSYERTIRFIK